MAFSGYGWWTAQELAELQRNGGVIIPPWLPEHLPWFLDAGAPAEPVHLGELGPVF
jgi:hypothetical protein